MYIITFWKGTILQKKVQKLSNGALELSKGTSLYLIYPPQIAFKLHVCT